MKTNAVPRTADNMIDIGFGPRRHAIAKWHGKAILPYMTMREKVLAIGSAAGGALAMAGVVWVLSVWGLVKCV